MSYTPTTFNNGGAPGISASYLNGVENMLASINSAATDGSISANGSGILTLLGLVNNDAGQSIVGTTSGTATLYQFLRGNVKAFFLYFTGYRNSTSTEQKITLPQAFAHYAHYYAAGGIPQMHFYNGGSQVNGKISTITNFPSPPGPGNSTSGLNAINGLGYGDVSNAFDAIGLGVSLPQSYTTGLFVIGI
jgi:hypothetical protein